MLGCKSAVAAAGEVDDMIDDAAGSAEGAAGDACWATTGGCDACVGCNWEGGGAG